MAGRAGVLMVLVGLGVVAGGCGGYGDEVEKSDDERPALEMIKDVNAWLAEKKKHGAVFETYEQVKAAYEAEGHPWPPFPPNSGTWVYFPRRARVIEVHHKWVTTYLKYLSRRLQETGRHAYNFDLAARLLRDASVGSPRCPGYQIEFKIHGSQGFFAIVYEQDGMAPVRGNHTATEDFDIGNDGRMLAVPGGH